MNTTVMLLVLLLTWTDASVTECAPAMPEREVLHGAARAALALYPRANHNQVLAAYAERAARYRGVQVAGYPEARHALWAGHMLADLDAVLTAMHSAHAARRRLGAAPSRDGQRRLRVLDTLNAALRAFAAALDAQLPAPVRRELTALADSLASTPTRLPRIA